MKRLISTLVLVFAFVFGANLNAQKVEKATNATQAEITFEKLEHDYGEVQHCHNHICFNRIDASYCIHK